MRISGKDTSQLYRRDRAGAERWFSLGHPHLGRSDPELVCELYGHSDYVASLDWSPDGTQLVSGSGDCTVRIWDSVPSRVRSSRDH